MKISLFTLSALFGSAAAFVPASTPQRGSVAVNAAIDDLKVIAEKSNPVLKFYDPLNLSETPIFDNTADQTIGFLRQAEIKHGRVAMAAFVGYCIQANGIHWPWPQTLDGTPFPGGVSPPEQWDAMPDVAKWQIILFVGFLEWFSEAADTHYMRGGVPGKFPDFTENPEFILHPVPFNLYDPFKLSTRRSAEDKERGLIAEINNGRLAMIGIMGFLAEQKLDGAVPLLKGLVPHYDGEPMAPFG
jgi:hypothetical protein